MSDYTFRSSFPDVRQRPKRLLSQKMIRDREDWLKKAERKLKYLAEGIREEEGLRLSLYWGDYYRDLYAERSEDFKKDAARALEEMKAEFAAEQERMLESFRGTVAEHLKDEIEQKFKHQIDTLRDQLVKTQNELAAAKRFSHEERRLRGIAEAELASLREWKEKALGLMSESGLLRPD